MRRAVRVWLSAGVLLLCGVAQASAQTKVIDPYSLPMVQAACGGESESAPQGSVGSHGAEPALKPGLARVYVITETRGLFGKLGGPVRLGIDGHWFGVNHEKLYGYSYVDVTPGVHHLCVAAKVRGAVPHTNKAVLLQRVEAVAGQSYSFYNQYVRIMGMFTLRPMSVDEGAMFAQALPAGGATGIPTLWKTAEAQAACDTDAGKMPKGPVPPPQLPGPPEAGKALVYFYLRVPQFGWRGEPIRIAVDGHNVGMSSSTTYFAATLSPGRHRYCAVMTSDGYVKPTLDIGQIDVVAGQTSFVELRQFVPFVLPQSVEGDLPVRWLRRIAAMPKSDNPDQKALKRWSQSNFPASSDELRACGIPADDAAVSDPKMAVLRAGPDTSTIVFLLRSDIKRLSQAKAFNMGVDGHWRASLQSTSWVSLPVVAGLHKVCVHVRPRERHRSGLEIARVSSLYLSSPDVAEGQEVYFESTLIADEDGYYVTTVRLDPDEGAMLVALYPREDVVRP